MEVLVENETQFKIEKGIKMPASRANGKKPAKYPFSSMEVGDSFAVPTPNEMTAVEKRKQYNAILGSGQRKGKRFAGRMLENHIRVWRTE